MNGKDIREAIDNNNEIINDIITTKFFTLNEDVANLLEENEQLQELCEHKFENGRCIYCDLEEE